MRHGERLMATTPSEIYPSLLPLLEQAAAGATVVTANRRAARFLRLQFAAVMQQRGRAGWASPTILPWESWLDSLWQQLLLTGDEDRLLLNAAQEFQLWESIVQVPAGEGSLSARSLAELAQQAWRLLGDYSVDRARWQQSSRGRRDWRAMSQWSAAFEKRCDSKRWLSHTLLPHELSRAIRAGRLTGPASLCLVGFDRTTPAQEELIAALAPHTQVHRVSPAAESEQPARRTEAGTADEEIEAAALWAQERLHRGARRLAIISPVLGSSRGNIERTLSRVIGQDKFNFSLGLPLAQYALAKTALLLLRWGVGALSLDEVSWLLLSPNFGGDAGAVEISARARFDAYVLRSMDWAQPLLSLRQFAGLVGPRLSSSPEEWSALTETLRCCRQAQEFMEKAASPNREQTAFEWAEVFNRALELFGFPGNRRMGSQEFQTLDRWRLLLDEFAALSFDGSRIRVPRAIECLQRLAEKAIFQPENQERPVQVMGALEAAGSLFDGIWFLGARAQDWPGAGRSNPLLPWQVQRDAAMLHSSPSIDYQWCEHITTRLAQSAPGPIFSWAKRYGAESAEPSPLITKFEPLSIAPQLDRLHQLRPVKSQPFSDALPLLWTNARGSLPSSALRDQAACPFKAFATVRLQARPLEAPDDGLDPRQRGKFLHDLMRSIWTSAQEPFGLRDLKTLQQRISDGSLHAFVVSHADARIQTKSHDRWELQFYAAERERLTGLVEDWLRDVEALRADFEVSEAEKSYQGLQIGEATFTVKVDRIDRLLKGDQFDADAPEELVLLDYKSGEATVNSWQGMRPDEPQLLLYATCALAEKRLAAVAFAQIRADKIRFRGVSLRTSVLPKLGPKDLTLESDLPRWRQAVLDLTANFVAGEARVDPKDYPVTCRTCACSSFCRVAEIRRDAPGADSDVSENEDE